MAHSTTCPCGAEIVQNVGPGRPRKRCHTCSPVRPKRAVAGPKRSGFCLVCSAPLGNRRAALYCSDACKWEARPRVPCRDCGGPTGWAARQGVVTPRCRACQRENWSHGTHKGYVTMKCKCDKCRAWSKVNRAAYLARRKAQGNPVRKAGGSQPWISEKVRFAVYERDDWTCQICGEPVDRDANPQSDWYPSIDHIVPKSKGGSHRPDNLRTAHRWCNCVRGDKDYHAELFVRAS